MDLKEMINKSGLKRRYLANRLGLGEAHFSLMLSGERIMPEVIENEVKRLCSIQIQA